MKQLEVERMDRLGEEFDPECDEVIATAPLDDENQKTNIIVDEVQKGYLFRGKLVRPSKVRVTKQ